MKIHSNNTIRHHRRRGAALVEAAIVLPVFFMAIVGIVEFGRGMMVSQLVTNGSREAARRAIFDGSTNIDIEDYTQNRMANSIGCDPTDIDVTIVITPDPNNNTTGNNLVNAQAYDLVTVTVSVPYDDVSFFTGRYLAGKSLSGETTMRHE